MLTAAPTMVYTSVLNPGGRVWSAVGEVWSARWTGSSRRERLHEDGRLTRRARQGFPDGGRSFVRAQLLTGRAVRALFDGVWQASYAVWVAGWEGESISLSNS
jgi:hypothetical protein